MGWIVLTVIMAIAFAISLRLRLSTTRTSAASEWDRGSVSRSINFSGDGFPIVAVGIAALYIVLTIFCSAFTVENGHIGLVKQFGSYVSEAGPGMNFKAPWMSVDEANGKIQSKSIKMDGQDNRGSAVSKDTQPVYMDLVVNYHISLADARKLYSTVGPNYYKTIIENRAKQTIKAVTVQYSSTEIAANREKIRVAAADALEREVADNGIIIDDLLIADLNFSPDFVEAIERKQVATQDALAAKEKVKQKEAEALQLVATAKGEAQAAAINGKALRENPESLAKLYIEKIVPGQVMVVPANGNSLFQLPGLKAMTAGQ